MYIANKYHLTYDKIKQLKILDWKRLKNETRYNEAMAKEGSWWCLLIGCNLGGKYNDFDEFWIGFNEDDNNIDCHFTTWEGMESYTFDNFYEGKDIENEYDMNVQVNAIRWLNMMIDRKILGV